MRRDQVFALLKHAGNDLKKIESEYNKALRKKEIPDSLKIDIKNFMENLRSVLDYMAHDIYEIHIKPYRKARGVKEIEKVYFPYGRTQNDFNSRVGYCLPELNTIHPKLFSVLESIQHHSSKDSWLCDFCDITNEKKHDSLTPQERIEIQTMTASVRGASVTIPLNNPNFSVRQGPNAQVFIGGVPVKLTNGGIIPLAPGLERIIKTWVSFIFSGTGIDVLPFLKKVHSNVESLANQVYNNL